MSQQTIHRGIRKLIMAPWLAAGSYGASHLIRGARNMSVALTVETDELRGDDVVLDRYTKVIAADVTIEMATVDLEWIDMVTGGTLVYNANYYDLNVDENDDPPYVGIVGRVVASGGAGDLHIQINKARISGNVQLTAQVGSYMLPGATFQGVADDNGIYRLRNFTAPTELELPLRTATGGFA